ncbi:MAG: hypothetical protein U1E23_05200 [Reyranellaceae bacterium]
MLSGAALFADVVTYDGFGEHRTGSPGAERALDWIARELERAGLQVADQRFTAGRQYDFGSGSLAVGGTRRPVMPHWWPPGSQPGFALSAPIAPAGFARLSLPFEGGAYLGADAAAAVRQACAARPTALLLTIEHPSGEIFTYNVDQDQAPWPVPVILVAPRDRPLLDRAELTGEQITVSVDGRWQPELRTRNVIGRLARGTGRTVVVSTPVTSWFTSTCERGPGIAGFLGLARIAASRWPGADFVFVATAGHEIGHGGMETFLATGAPSPSETVAWAHLGASLACRAEPRRVVLCSDAVTDTVRRGFGGLGVPLRTGPQARVGELRDVLAAGYPRCFGMAGTHRFFHTPADRAELTGPELLEPVIDAFARTLDALL